jgi:uncharacterized membrane protein YhhN
MSKTMNSAFLVFVLLYMLGLYYLVDFLWLLKVIPIGILGIGVFNTQASFTRTVLLVALVFSACGDLLLAFDKFIYGVAAFLLAQLSYALIFKTYWQGITTRWLVSIVLLMYMLLMAWLLLPSLGDLKIPVIAYLLAIGVMGFLAVQSSLSIRWAVLGALVFIISDSLIAINKFVSPIPFENYWVMSTYYVAQFMLVISLLKSASLQK